MPTRFTILFVEDDSGVRASTAEVLAKSGFRMLVASDGEEALRLLADNHVDVLFTDIVMPGIDGISLAKRAKELRPEIKVMFMTGYYSRAAEASALGKLLYKPIRGQHLSQAILALVGAE